MSGDRSGRALLLRYGLLAAVWAAVYRNLEPGTAALSRVLFDGHLSPRMASAAAFFLYEAPKVLMLLVAIVFVVGIVRTFFDPARTRRLLSGRRAITGNILAALLGIVTPFCSCSAVPLFIGFISAGVPLGVTLSFLIAAPMINEIALVLLASLFGLKIAALYVGTGLSVAIGAGWLLGRMGMERHLEDWVRAVAAAADGEAAPTDWRARVDAGREAVRDIVLKVWPYLLLGIGAGAFIHGYVPEGLLARVMGRDAWWSVPVAVLIGVPMYANAASIFPVVQALLAKGAALGTALAFMMSVIGLSLPEAVILRKVMKPRLLLAFFGVVAVGIILIGYLFNQVIQEYPR